MSESGNTRSAILEAGRSEFIRRGYSGSRLKSIAENAGVTKAMIHYYFDDKDSLYREIYRDAIESVFSDLFTILTGPAPLFEKIDQFIKRSVSNQQSHADLVAFVMTELDRVPELTVDLARQALQPKMSDLNRQIKEAAGNYEIAAVDPDQLLLNMIALCFFPYTARNFSRGLIDPDDDQHYYQFLERRKDLVCDVILNWLTH
ncbi:MAG: TetR/AcrR family transcriptional regulator [Balneolaceae bacterium]|nr:TetR/AcrR family transcriptional regulator [Balneolaceae bacterium]